MVNKRPFHDEGIYEVGCKTPIQQGDQETYHNEGIARCDSPPNLPSDEGERSGKKFCSEEKAKKEFPSEDLNGAKEELQRNASSSNGNANDKYVNPEAAFHLSFFPQLFELGHQEASLPQPRDMYSFLLAHPPQKIVPVGPEHQAILPDWNPQGRTKSSDSCFDIEEKLMGTCLVPMPVIEACAYGSSGDGGTRDICSCLDGGSISCVRKHVTEAREKLREELGQKFGRLGFYDMGEEVAQKWSGEEEHSFHDTVYSNPASLGKNFWHILPAVFPTRMKQELVNYYFNVFILRKRAAQNRFDPLNIDSDDDEWHVSELGMTDEDEDEDESVAGSVDENREGELPEGNKMEGEPYVRAERFDFLKYYHHINEEDRSAVESFDQFGLPRDHEFRVWEEGEKDVLKGGVGLLAVGEEDKGGMDDISGSVADSGANALGQFTGKTSSPNNEDHDAGDDSCMSYENQSGKVDPCGPVDDR